MHKKPLAPHLFTRRSVLAGAAGLLAFGNATGTFAQQRKAGPYFKTKDELDQSLKTFGVGSWDRSSLLQQARPTTILSSTALEDKDIPVGASKIGGAPDMPENTDWPMRKPSSSGKRDVDVLRKLNAENPSPYYQQMIDAKQPLANRDAPLAFVLQFDLAAAAAAGPVDPDIPTDGRLLVFFDLVLLPWFGEQQAEKSFSLLYLPAAQSELKRRPVPDLGMALWGERHEGDTDEQAMRLPSARIDPTFSYTLPGDGSYPMLTRYPHPQEPPHRAWLDALTSGPGDGCQLYGWPNFVQSDPAIDLGAEDVKFDLPRNDDYIRTIRGLAGPIENWIPLLTITGYASDSVDFNGGYYVMIRRTDLRNKDFSKAVIVYQTD
ncbi:DUF1963 domain-containing protein [Agrobacterium vitis]|uniref:DUF1963 domain-containing protein n=1 Tax=Rhizobium/Agrobacterium group TaxID=227290 RepID=UPI0012E84DC9|nr:MULTISPECIES: DUF1963 domain-containing protein [Rhizobium/Agrobacterium group]MCF1434628.1 DUF1963 domain-containing protein [Allorhizobium ampelinum]MUO88422.1 DUF1963 domain-containing protein [Agrobacterium vitis]MUZ54462.1 DUF1963 domain-containing protein [Agrobacterium vitis]MUZ90424.1 DUF1963 domain-containing protein [Agrobacterium vitis]MVA40827.1 DUF1963 domain-containing protein [Agrobacterium vitis]